MVGSKIHFRVNQAVGDLKRDMLVNTKSMSDRASVMHIGLEIPMLFGLGNVLRTLLLGDRIAATIGVSNATSESRTIRKIVP